MATRMWKRVRGGALGARVFAAYLTLVLAVAMAGPGLAVYAAEGEDVTVPPPAEEAAPAAEEEPVVEPPAAEVPAEAPAIEPEAEPAAVVPAEEPIAPAVAPAEASVEAPVVTASVIMPSASVTPVLISGNPSLEDGGVKIQPPVSGTYHYDDVNEVNQPGVPLDFELVITVSPDGTTFDFTSNKPIIEVVVKGGPDAYSYVYPGGTYGDTGLVSPLNRGGQVPALSHMVFYFGEEEEPETGDILVYKYNDLNENGVHDTGEPMLEDWDFTLYQDQQQDAGPLTPVVIATGSTNALGELLFGDLEPGDYYVTETLQGGWDNTTALTQGATVVAGETEELWFGNVELEDPPETGDLLIHKFQDTDEDGFHDAGEPMLADWEFTVTVETPPLEPIGGSAAMLIGSGLTDGDGELEFTNLAPMTYTVRETLRSGWDNTTPLTQTAAVVAGQTAELWFGNVPEEEEPETGDLIVYKYNDENENGVHDPGEPMLEDWEFTLGREPQERPEIGADAMIVLGSGLTDADGELYFAGLDPGEYLVVETPQDGWHNTTPLAQTVEIEVGETTEVWFGNVEEYLPFTWLDLAITKVADDHAVDEGQLVTYTLTYWNNGNLGAEGYTIVDDFDERYLTIVDAGGGVVAGGKITWAPAGVLTKEMGPQKLTYKARVSSDMPDGTTNIDNVVVISHPRDSDPSNNRDDERIVVKLEEPYLPFTGGEYALLLGFAVAAAAFGLLLRSRTDTAV